MKNVIVNMNGDAAASLRAELLKAYNAITAAEVVLARLTINARNYQSCDDPQLAFDTDRKEWIENRAKLTSISEYLLDCEDVIQRQQ